MNDMPRPRPPHLHRERDHWVVRIGHGPRIRLKETFGTLAFTAEYTAAIQRLAGQASAPAGKDTLGWLWLRYRESGAWQSLSAATKRQRENVMRGVLETAKGARISDITRKAIIEGRDRRADRPAAARHFVDTLRGLFRWAVDAEMIEADPTRDVRVAKPRTDGHHTWTAEEIERFHTRYPRGTRERVAFDLLLFTGLRRGDAVKAGRQHIKDGVLTLRTEKTGETVRVPVMQPLVETLAAGPTGALAFIAGERGEPMAKESFGNWFRQACNAAGCPGSAHGLRKALATIMAESGVSVHELESVFAWRGGGMAALYTRTANRAAMARTAVSKVEQTMDALFPQNGESSHTRKNIK